MKTVMSLYVSVELAQALKTKAQALGVPVSTFAEQALREALGGESTSPETARLAPERYTRRETAVLAAVDALVASYAALERENPVWGNRMFPLGEVSRQAGLYPSEALQGLRSLERRKVLSCVMTPDLRFIRAHPETPDVEHWGRATLTRNGT